MSEPKLGEPWYRELLDSLLEGVYYVDRERAISFWNRGAEKLTGHQANSVVGRHCYDGVLVHTDKDGNPLCNDKCPALAVMESGKSRETLVYLRHHDGHRLPVMTRISPLRNQSGAVVGAVELFSDASADLFARDHVEALARIALLDPLTGIGNRRYGEMMLQNRVSSFDRYGWPFGVLFVDVDHFKAVNDTRGHAVGDDVLRMVAKTLTNSVRSSDIVSRWGGEEFLVILNNLVPEQLFDQAEKVRRLLEQSSLQIPTGAVRITASIGAVGVPPGRSLERLVEQVDACMYEAKNTGRNRVCLQRPEAAETGSRS